MPTTNDLVEVLSGIVITNDMTNATCMALDSSEDGGNGTVVMAPGSTLLVGGALEGYGTQNVGEFDASATNCTVIYQGNAFWAKRTDYWNLIFSGWGDFYNGAQNGYPITSMTIYGNFIVNGTNVPPDQTNLYTGVYVECGGDFTIDGNFYIGASNAWDCSVGNITVLSNTICAGVLWDKDANNGSNYFAGGLTILPSSMILTNLNNTLVLKMGNTNVENLGPNGVYGPGNNGTYGGSLYVWDVQEWAVGGNFTNNGIVGFGTNYGSIDFTGTGVIAGSNAITMPTMTIDGNYEIADTITLTTNYPVINGTIVFDLANTNQIILNAGTNWFWYSTNGTLSVINSGAPPVSGNSYQLFNNIGNTNYGGQYAFVNLPSLSNGLSWTNNLLVNGSIAVVGGAASLPIITSSHYNPATLQFTLTWTSAPGATYTVQETPVLKSATWNALQTNIPSGGSTTTYTVTMPGGTSGFIRILVQ
ncbi:MAG TPA: hypothetical protein VHG89_03260 [Verrucomicrobiae bacterium]|nr:hypothetical protein [Verrucomicrobiae bacterium]